MLQCEEELRNFLLFDIYPLNFDNIYVGFTSLVSSASPNLKDASFYFTRTTENQILFDNVNKVMYFYCIIPYFFFVGNIKGLNPEHFINSKIHPIGGHFLTTDGRIEDPNSTSYMFQAIEEFSKITVSDVQQKNIQDIFEKNSDKYLYSKSFEATFSDKSRAGEI